MKERTSRQMLAIWSSASLLFSIMSVNAPPSMNSMTTQSSLFLMRYASRKLTTFGWEDSFMTTISLTMSSLRGCWARSICLIATLEPVASCLARKTMPDALVRERKVTKGQPQDALHRTRRSERETHPCPIFLIFA